MEKDSVFSILNDVLKIIKNANKEPEAPPNGPFGNFLWASYREGVPAEKENELEKQIYNELKSHFLTYNRKGLPALTSELLSMCVALGWYKKVLHPPPHKTLLRGLKVKNKDELKKLFNIDEDIDDQGTKIFEEKITLPCSNGNSTSWTFKKSVTKEFSEAGKRGFSVTLYADVADNPDRFLAGPGGLYDVEGLSKYHKEKETVGLEPIKIRKITWKKI